MISNGRDRTEIIPQKTQTNVLQPMLNEFSIMFHLFIVEPHTAVTTANYWQKSAHTSI